MILTLTVAGANRSGMAAPSCSFGPEGGTIGRDAGCSWTLPDPRAVLSGQHLRVDFDSGAFYVTDTSRNGVFLNDEVQPIGHNESQWLADGDRIRISDYTLVVQVEDRPAALVARPASAHDDARTLFGGLADPTAAAAGGLDPLAQIGPATAGRAGHYQPRATQAGTDELSDLFEVGAGDEGALVNPAVPAVDPLHAMRSAGTVQPPQPVSYPTAHLAPPPATGGMMPPQVIPENWLVGGPEDLQLPPPRPPREVAPPPAPADDPVTLLQRRQAARDRTAPAPREGPPAAMGGSASPAQDAALLAALWAALGIDAGKMSAEQQISFVGEVGRAVRATAEGLIPVLSMRASTKNEFELEQTMVRATENNLFKFASNADEMLMLAVSNRNRMFMPMDRAIAASFTDIKANELATIAAVQLTIRSLIDRFQPQKIAAQAKQRDGRQFFNSSKASCWDLFSEMYSSLAADADEASSRLFTAEFGRAYRERMAAVQGPPGPGHNDRT